MLKDILLHTIKDIDRLEKNNNQIMQDCIDRKLNRSLDKYESNLEETCKYILTRNPISMIKALATPNRKPKESEEE